MVIGSHDSTTVFTILSKPKGNVEHRTGMLMTMIWSARLEMCQWRRETLDKESIWDEARSTSPSRW
jgi:hypothetical protein